MRYFVMIAVVFSFATAAWASPGYQLTRADLQTMGTGFAFALNKSPDRHAVEWVNPGSGVKGATVPLKTYRTSYGQVCREYMTTLQVAGSLQQQFGTACRQADGSWKTAGEQPVVRYARVVKRAETMQRCPYLSKEHPPAQGVERQRFHSREFLEKYRRLHNNPGPGQERQPAKPDQPAKLLKFVVN